MSLVVFCADIVKQASVIICFNTYTAVYITSLILLVAEESINGNYNWVTPQS
jgi:hypothetical protein